MRNFGLSHLSDRAKVLPRALGAAANAGVLLFSREACFERLHHGLGNAHRPARSGVPARVVVTYRGRVLFAHGGGE